MFILVIISFVLLVIFIVRNFSVSTSQLRTSRGPLQNAFYKISLMVLVSFRRLTPFPFADHPHLSGNLGNVQPRKCVFVKESTGKRNAE